MAEIRCDREDEILEALGAGRSPSSFGDELRAHLTSCASCRELIAVASALLDDQRALVREAPIPGSGVAWWRASMRARRETARAAMRTARLLQVALVAAAMVVAFVLVGPRIAPAEVRQLLAASAASFAGMTVPLLAFAAWLVLAPVAVYFVVSEE